MSILFFLSHIGNFFLSHVFVVFNKYLISHILFEDESFLTLSLKSLLVSEINVLLHFLFDRSNEAETCRERLQSSEGFARLAFIAVQTKNRSIVAATHVEPRTIVSFGKTIRLLPFIYSSNSWRTTIKWWKSTKRTYRKSFQAWLNKMMRERAGRVMFKPLQRQWEEEEDDDDDECRKREKERIFSLKIQSCLPRRVRMYKKM